MQATDTQHLGTLLAQSRGMENISSPGTGYNLILPDRYPLLEPRTTREAKFELGRLAERVSLGTQAIVGVYMRICDIIRHSNLSDQDVREALAPHFPAPRISELIRLSHAPLTVYEKYTAGFFGFKTAVKICRLYHLTPTAELRRRKISQAANRLVSLMDGPGEIRVKDRTVTVA